MLGLDDRTAAINAGGMSIDDGICQFVIIFPHKNNATLTRNKSLLGARSSRDRKNRSFAVRN
jgi:hypothetical protein